jgi:hypothetical protein
MRGVAYTLLSVALMFGALTSASAGCYGDCTGYQDNRGAGYGYGNGYDRPVYREPAYSEAPAYDASPRGHTVYYERGPEIPVSYHETPAYRTSYYDDGYGYRSGYGGYRYGGYGYRGYGGYGYGGGVAAGCGAYGCGVAGCGAYGCGAAYRGYGGGYGYGYRGYGYGYGYGGGYGYGRPCVGGGCSQTVAGYGLAGYGYGGYGCRTAYIPYGWTWTRGTTC